MDTLTHALSGALLARAFVARRSLPQIMPAAPGAPVAAPASLLPWQAVVVGAFAGAFPDIDSLAQLAGGFTYLRHHRGITHSLPMAPLWALLLSLWLQRWFTTTRRPGGWKAVFPIALAGLLIHIAGDWITQFGTLLLAPFSDRRFGLGAVFIIDLVLTGLLVGGLALAAMRPGARWPAVLGLAAVAGWVTVCWTGRQEALQVGARYVAAGGVPVQWIDAIPRPASPFNWSVTVFDGTNYHVAHVNTRRTEPLVAGDDAHFVRRLSAPFLPERQLAWQRVPRFGGDGTPAWVQAAWQHEAFATFRWFALAPALVLAREQPGVDGRPERCAVFRDLRFETPGRTELPFRYGLCLAPGGDPARLVRLEGERLLPL